MLNFDNKYFFIFYYTKLLLNFILYKTFKEIKSLKILNFQDITYCKNKCWFWDNFLQTKFIIYTYSIRIRNLQAIFFLNAAYNNALVCEKCGALAVALYY